MSDVYKSKHSGKAIDQSVKDVALLKERIGKAEEDIQYLNIHKANENIVPKSITDLEPNASLIHRGVNPPPSSIYDIWVYPISETEAVLRVKNKLGEWVDVSGGNSDINEDEIIEIINTEIQRLKDSGELDGEDGISVTHEWDGATLIVTSASGTSSADLKGEKGDSGVYVGSGEMPEGYDVQIDPNGEAEEYCTKKEMESYINETFLGGAW